MPKASQTDDKPSKPTFVINGLASVDILARMDKALRPLGVYQRAGKIVRVGPVVLKDRNSAPLPAQAIRELNSVYLGALMNDEAAWIIRTADGKNKSADTRTLASEAISRGGHDYPFQYLTGLANVPTMRADGTILDSPGYDEKSGLLFDPRGVEFPPIPDVPSETEVADAKYLIDDVLSEFPFSDESGGAISRSVAVAAFLSVFVRPLLPACPGFAFTAPRPGTGKSYMVDLIATAATGYAAHPIAAGHTGEEFEKRLVAELIAGRPILSVDNVQNLLNDPLLCQMLTAPKVTPRILGKSENAEIEMTAAVYMNGNNIAVSQDMVRRVLVCRLDRDEERPEQHQFKQNPLADVQANRPKYVTAALTLLRHHQTMLAMDAAPTLPAYAGYDDWSRMVRGCVVGLGYADPVQSIERSYADDPARESLSSLFDVWVREFGRAKVQVKEIVEKARHNTKLREALIVCEVDYHQNDINARSLGRYLRRNEDIRIGGWKLISPGSRDGSRTYAMYSPDSGGGVVIPLHPTPRQAEAQEEFTAEYTQKEAALP